MPPGWRIFFALRSIRPTWPLGAPTSRSSTRLGLTYTQYIAIIALSEEDNQSVGGLGEKLFLESNTLTPILKKLETLGYIRRQRDPADERQVRVSLTPEGRQLREKALPMNLVAAAGLGEDFPVVQKAVVRLRSNLLKAARGQGAKADDPE